METLEAIFYQDDNGTRWVYSDDACASISGPDSDDKEIGRAVLYLPMTNHEVTDYRRIHDQLQARADNAYCGYIDQLRRDECLGWEIKVEKGVFGEAELKAHKDAAEKLGRHRALQEACNLLHELLNHNSTEPERG